jgi:predicted GH43/DUF377 family glycosyl hydrolase
MANHDLLAEIRTPTKIDRLLLAPSFQKGAFDSHTVDCPNLFWHEGCFYMTYVGYDGLGYQTGLASSEDLLTWKREGMIFGRGPAGSPTEYNAALNCVLRDNELYGPGTLKKVDGRFIGVYHAYPEPGLEEGAAIIGLCTSDDLYHWQAGAPILYPQDGAAWESGGLYKPWLLEHEGIYYLFYNAKNLTDGRWIEQTGLATSRDLLHWQRHAGNPILPVGPQGTFDDIFASDPCVFHHKDLWWMYYYSLSSSDHHARDSAAYSSDLLTWTKTNEILVDVGAPGSIDELYAHKPGIIAKAGRLYHFYCAVRPAKEGEAGEIEYAEMRGIAGAHNTTF